MGWIGYDLDGTLARWGTPDRVTTYVHYDVLHIGDPIPKMLAKCRGEIDAGKDVRIFTARVGPVTDEEALNAIRRGVEQGIPGFTLETPTPVTDWLNYQRELIEAWCKEHLGCVLPITCTKDFHMWQLYDDRCIQVRTNTGDTLEERVQILEAGMGAIAQALQVLP